MSLNLIKKLAIGLSLLGFAAVNTGCNSDDVVAGAIVGGVVGGIIGSDGHRHHRYPRRHRRCRGYYCSYSVQANQSQNALAMLADQQTEVEAVMAKWNLPEVGAERYVSAMEQARSGDINGFKKIGLSPADVVRLVEDKEVDINDLDRMSRKLRTDNDTSLAMLQAFVNEYNAQKADSSGAVWALCTDSGVWKTPEVGSCSDLNAAGCSPETGASSCLPVL